MTTLFSRSVLGMALFGAVLMPAYAQPITLSDVGFATPESVEYYAAQDVYLVANINGSPFDKDDNGFISKVSPSGEVVNLKWLDGASPNVRLNAPKGFEVIGNKLYVADIDVVRVFSLPDGQQLKDIKIEGSTFLNGLSRIDDQHFYLTDSGLNLGYKASGQDALYKVSTAGEVQIIQKSANLGRPNGVTPYKTGVAMVTFGTGKLHYLNSQGQTTALMTLPGGSLDGLLAMPNDALITSSWETSSIYHIDAQRRVTTLINHLDSPADLGFDSTRNRLLIPLFKTNEIVILPLKK
ncbi:hypothetical protein [Thiomicrorhabdus aquaedulcis]|uniref:hypothetical protein n=1 Tax=Thiomicrorhabdus aquaedulcis TaxID=2211106 RepID=UPI000FD78D97|nr:hypothetical protein [Thiomicrorhabdus aquaedulcis]